MRVCINFTFEVVGVVSLEADERLRFPPLPTTPGVYRFRLLGLSDPISTYIGDTDNLRRRTRHYSAPGPSQQTNIRMHARLLQHLKRGGVVEFAAMTAATIMVGDATAPVDFGRKSHRLLLENAALVSNPRDELIENLS